MVERSNLIRLVTLISPIAHYGLSTRVNLGFLMRVAIHLDDDLR